MNNVIEFKTRPVGLLWAPGRSKRENWRLFAKPQVIEFRKAEKLPEPPAVVQTHVFKTKPIQLRDGQWVEVLTE
jgi:hypothetical protein